MNHTIKDKLCKTDKQEVRQSDTVLQTTLFGFKIKSAQNFSYFIFSDRNYGQNCNNRNRIGIGKSC